MIISLNPAFTKSAINAQCPLLPFGVNYHTRERARRKARQFQPVFRQSLIKSLEIIERNLLYEQQQVRILLLRARRHGVDFAVDTDRLVALKIQRESILKQLQSLGAS